MTVQLMTPSSAAPAACPPLDCAATALFLDLDGTLAAIAPRPEDVGPDPARTALLRRLQARLDGRLAVVSGRTIEDVDRILSGAVAAVAGVHGLERRTRAGLTSVEPAPGLSRARSELAALEHELRGLRIEDKTIALALHYRAAPHLERRVNDLAADLAARHGLESQFGRMVAELKTPGADKGASVRAFMTEPPFSGAVPVFVGDDLTDEHGFEAAEALGGYGVLVAADRPSRASRRLADVDAVLAWLDESVR